tara:strand:- start:155 stop:460 length:306 start_codon:yes stop_codon:yes gene_type:complete
MAKHFNITGELTQELLAAGDNTPVSKISLTNIEGTNKCTVDLYIEKKLKGKFYLLKGVELPMGVTFSHGIMGFSNKVGEFGLYIKLNKSASETPAVDVILQ